MPRPSSPSRIDAAVYPGEQGCPLPARHRRQGGHLQARRDATPSASGWSGPWKAPGSWRSCSSPPRTGPRQQVVTGGTDVHQLLVDLAPGGREAGAVLAGLNQIGISANAIALAYDPLVAPACSGLRFGATALACRGFAREEFAEVGADRFPSLGKRGRGPGGDARQKSCRAHGKDASLLLPRLTARHRARRLGTAHSPEEACLAVRVAKMLSNLLARLPGRAAPREETMK